MNIFKNTFIKSNELLLSQVINPFGDIKVPLVPNGANPFPPLNERGDFSITYRGSEGFGEYTSIAGYFTSPSSGPFSNIPFGDVNFFQPDPLSRLDGAARPFVNENAFDSFLSALDNFFQNIFSDFINSAPPSSPAGDPSSGFFGAPLSFEYVFNNTNPASFTMNDLSLADLDPASSTFPVTTPQLTFLKGTAAPKTYDLVLGDNNVNGTDAQNPLSGQLGKSNLILSFDANDVIVGDIGFTSFSDKIIKTGDDVIHGGNHNDTIYADIVDHYGDITKLGNDVAHGGEGNDYLYGDVSSNYGNINTTGNDTLDGGNGNDSLYGDAHTNAGTITTAGNDKLEGGAGNDSLYGDVHTNAGTITTYGKDTFVFDLDMDFGHDTIFDFNKDVLQFKNLRDQNNDGKIDLLDLAAITTLTNDNGKLKAEITTNNNDATSILFDNINLSAQNTTLEDYIGATAIVV